MKFSVILPIYNVEAYLAECVESILSQTYNDYELILVNDGSKDSSLSICEEYAKKYSSIKIVNQPNAGLSMARNNGLSVAQGDYIIFIDSNLSIKNVRTIENDVYYNYGKDDIYFQYMPFYKRIYRSIHNRFM